MTTIKNGIYKLKKYFDEAVKSGNKAIIKRKVKHSIHFEQLILFNSTYIHSFSYSNASTITAIESGEHFSENAYNKKRFEIDINIFEKMNIDLLKLIYKPTDKRYIAVDGSIFILGSGLIDEGYKPSKYDSYAKGRVSGMIDINNSIPINYLISDGYYKESSLVIQQFKYLNKGDVLIFDRGYYSEQFIKILNENGLDFIFRMKEKIKFFRN